VQTVTFQLQEWFSHTYISEWFSVHQWRTIYVSSATGSFQLQSNTLILNLSTFSLCTNEALATTEILFQTYTTYVSRLTYTLM
jgi:hypothetical protein